MKKLRISDTLSLPLDFVTGTQGIVATKGKGKTHLAQVEAEELLDAHQQIIAIDPTDVWWGLRSLADGKRPGYPIPVFGGRHGVTKLDPDSAVALADAIMDDGFSCVICTKGLPSGVEVRFVRELLERIYQRNRKPVHIFVDEADMFAPQKPFDPEDAKSIRAMSNIVRRGRSSGIGCTMITQRPSVLNKDVLSQVDMLMVLGMGHNLDIEPIERWMRLRKRKLGKNADAIARIEEMFDSLQELPQGDAWAWSPSTKLHKRFRARPKKTFDSGATPKVGQRKRVAKRLAPIDIKRLGESIAAQVQREKDNDPAELKKQVATLTRENERMKLRTPNEVVIVKKEKGVTTSVLKDAHVKRIEKTIARGEKAIAKFGEMFAIASSVIADVHEKAIKEIRSAQQAITAARVVSSPVAKLADWKPTGPALSKTVTKLRDSLVPARGKTVALDEIKRASPLMRAPATRDASTEKPPGAGELVILRALIQWRDGVHGRQLSVITGYKQQTRDTYISRLCERGLAERHAPGQVRVTDAGVAFMPDAEPLPTGKALRDYWLATLPKGEAQVLRFLIEANGEVTRDAITKETGFKQQTRDTYISRMMAKEIVVAPQRGIVAASDTLWVQ